MHTHVCDSGRVSNRIKRNDLIQFSAESERLGELFGSEWSTSMYHPICERNPMI